MGSKLGLFFCFVEYALLRLLFVWLLGSYIYLASVGGWDLMSAEPGRLYSGLFELTRLWFSGTFWIVMSNLIKRENYQFRRLEISLIFVAASSVFLIAQGLFFPLVKHHIEPTRIENVDLVSNILLSIYGSKSSIEVILKELVLELNLGLSAFCLLAARLMTKSSREGAA